MFMLWHHCAWLSHQEIFASSIRFETFFAFCCHLLKKNFVACRLDLNSVLLDFVEVLMNLLDMVKTQQIFIIDDTKTLQIRPSTVKIHTAQYKILVVLCLINSVLIRKVCFKLLPQLLASLGILGGQGGGLPPWINFMPTWISTRFYRFYRLYLR